MNKIILFFSLFFSSVCCAQATEKSHPPFSLVEYCSQKSSNEEYLTTLFQHLNKNKTLVPLLVKLMQQGHAPGCRMALINYLKIFFDHDSDNYSDKNFDAYFMLAFSAGLPEAKKLIEIKIDKGQFSEWLDIFEKNDKTSYEKALTQWVNKVAWFMRKMDKAPVQSSAFYGKALEEADRISTPEALPIWNPIFIEKYYNYIIDNESKLSKKEFSNLNIIYAASNQSYREIFKSKMVAVINNNTVPWVESFREEPVWVQFKLIKLMERVTGGVIKRELIWLSKNHQNSKMRSLAQNCLERINSN